MNEEIVNESKSDELIESLNNEEKNDIVNLPLGEALYIEDTYPITSRDKTKLIVLAGPAECGKTTLITTLYQLFHIGPIDELFFAGSQTIKGFEQRAYHTRTNSGMNIPNTPRTRLGSLNSFLHLKLWNSANKNKHTLLLTDFSGEDFKNARANVELMREDFSLIMRADSLLILIDGDSITKIDERHSAIQFTQELLTTIKNARILKNNTKIYFVISKEDLVESRCENNPELKKYVDGIPDKLKNKFNDLENEIKFYKVAAMPEDITRLSVGYGINELIKDLIKESEICNNDIFLKQKEFKSEFNNFYKKY
jgi:phage terminase Nu1 subunit (DNA packaging protein)